MNYRPMDEKQADNLAAVIRGESNYTTTLHTNSQGRAFVNVIDPERKVRPFTVRDKVDWEDQKPKRKKRDA